MRIGNNGRRGMTLAELSIVLAVVAIVSTLVVTFVILVNERSNVSTARLDALNEVRLAESIIESCLEEKNAYEGIIDFSKESGELKIEENVVYTFLKIKDITFKAQGTAENDKLFICTVTYETFEGEGGTHTFLVDPHVGEGVTNQ